MLTDTKRTKILIMYKSGNHTTESIASKFGVTSRSVQRLASKMGVVRTQAQSNKLMAKHKNYYSKPTHLKAKRKWLTNKHRYYLISQHPYCASCGLTVEQGVRLEVDHKDEDATNNTPDNLQVLCNLCNSGKHYLARNPSSIPL